MFSFLVSSKTLFFSRINIPQCCKEITKIFTSFIYITGKTSVRMLPVSLWKKKIKKLWVCNFSTWGFWRRIIIEQWTRKLSLKNLWAVPFYCQFSLPYWSRTISISKMSHKFCFGKNGLFWDLVGREIHERLINNWLNDRFVPVSRNAKISWSWKLLIFVKHRNYCPSNMRVAANPPPTFGTHEVTAYS